MECDDLQALLVSAGSLCLSGLQPLLPGVVLRSLQFPTIQSVDAISNVT